MYICAINQTLKHKAMTHVTAPQITFGKQTQKLIKSLVPTASYCKQIGKDVIIKDANHNTVATWHCHTLKSKSLIVIW